MEGKLGSRSAALNGFSSACGGERVELARVHDIFPPQGNTGVSAGVVFIESGEHIDQKAVFDRKDCWLFGWHLEKTDLQYVMDLNEPCFVKLAKVEAGGGQDQEERLVVTSLWMGWPPQHGVYTKPQEIRPEDRYRFLLFLECHSLSISDFMTVIKGEKAPRTFLPFRKDEMKGTVIQLDRSSKMRGVRDVGAVSGVIKVDKGPLIGATVTFHRRNTWVLGYNMGKADLTNLFIEGQKVSLEAIAITGQSFISQATFATIPKATAPSGLFLPKGMQEEINLNWTAPNNTWGFLRTHGDEEVLVALNADVQEQSVDFSSLGEGWELVLTEPPGATPGPLSAATLPPLGGCVWQRRP